MSRELDLEVAEKVMGQVKEWTSGGNQWTANIPRYSTDVASVIQVVDKMGADGWSFGLAFRNGNWRACFYKDEMPMKADLFAGLVGAETSAEAICRAALKATEPARG